MATSKQHWEGRGRQGAAARRPVCSRAVASTRSGGGNWAGPRGAVYTGEDDAASGASEGGQSQKLFTRGDHQPGGWEEGRARRRGAAPTGACSAPALRQPSDGAGSGHCGLLQGGAERTCHGWVQRPRGGKALRSSWDDFPERGVSGAETGKGQGKKDAGQRTSSCSSC